MFTSVFYYFGLFLFNVSNSFRDTRSLLSFLSCELLSLVGRRAMNLHKRGVIRSLHEEKHSPGFSYLSHRDLGRTGTTTLDSNVALYALPSELAEGGLSSQMQCYSHYGFPTAGACLTIHWPEPVKVPGHEQYLDYLERSTSVCALLNVFGIPTQFLHTTGDLIVDLSLADMRYTPLTHLYAFSIMAGQENYVNRRYPLPQEPHYPTLELPQALQPAGREGFVMTRVMNQA